MPPQPLLLTHPAAAQVPAHTSQEDPEHSPWICSGNMGEAGSTRHWSKISRVCKLILAAPGTLQAQTRRPQSCVWRRDVLLLAPPVPLARHRRAGAPQELSWMICSKDKQKQNGRRAWCCLCTHTKLPASCTGNKAKGKLLCQYKHEELLNASK